MEWTGICGGMYEGHNKKLHMASGVYHSTCSEHIFEVNSGIIMDTHPIQYQWAVIYILLDANLEFLGLNPRSLFLPKHMDVGESIKQHMGLLSLLTTP
ncbi:hypothetical protein QQP08_015989 [Theobroma cacao]|nr:hypothetical protein QQP08_015989 [Theobroma cacao]